MKDYKMNFATKTLTITKAFAEEALNPESEASKIIVNCRAVCPNLRIVYRTRKPSKTSNPAKGMTYLRMERYISAFADCDEALSEFEKIKEISLSQSNSYQFVREWFVNRFPNYNEVPNFINGKAYLNPDIAVILTNEKVA